MHNFATYANKKTKQGEKEIQNLKLTMACSILLSIAVVLLPDTLEIKRIHQ